MVLVRSRPVLHHPFAPWLAPPDQVARTLVGREEALRNILEKIEVMGKGGGAKHVLIIGPRGMGKTHLACFIHHYVSQRIDARPGLLGSPENWTSVLFVEEEYPAHNTLANFLLSLCAKLQEADPVEEAWRLPETLRDQSDRIVTDCCLERIQEFSTRRGKKLLILVDNVQRILQQFPEADHHRLRAFLMDQAAILLVGTAPWLFKEVIHHKAPFFEFFETIYLSDLTEEEMHRLLKTRFREDGLEADFQRREENLRRKIPAIRKLTGGNPRLILFLYDIVTRSAFLEVESSLRELVEELSDYFRSRYDALADQPRKVLDTLAQMEAPGTPTDIARAARLTVPKVNAQLKRLKEWGYVESVKHERRRATHYDVTERLFRIWRQTATVAGRRRFKFLAQFLKIYYTPEEMVGIVHSYKNDFVAQELLLPKEEYKHAVEDLYYFQEAASSTLSREIFRLRMDMFIQLGEYLRAEQEAEYFRTESARAEDQPSVATAYEKQAEVHTAAGRYTDASKDVDQLVKMNHYEEALAAAEIVLTRTPTIHKAWISKGVAAGNLGDHAKALESFQKATELQPEEAEYWRLQAQALRNLGRHEEALEGFQKAAVLEPEEAEHWRLQAQALRNLGRHEERLRCLQKTVDLKPDAVSAWQELAAAAETLGDYQLALSCTQKATELEPQNALNWRAQAVILRKLGRRDERLRCLQKAVELKPDVVSAWIELAAAAEAVEDYQLALSCTQKATELEPQNALNWQAQAIALNDLDRHAEAVVCAERAVELQPGDAGFWELRGIVAANLGDHAKALESFQKTTDLRPEEAEHWRLRAEALRRLGRHEEALACADRAVALKPDDVNFFVEKARVLSDLTKIEEALAALDEALDRKGSEKDIFHERGHILLLSGRFEEARTAQEKGLTVAPDDWNLLIDRELARACQGEHGPNMEGLASVILAIKIPTGAPWLIIQFLFDVAAKCANRNDLNRTLSLLDVALSMPWQHEEWFGDILGVFVGKLLDSPPNAFEMAIDKIKEQITEPNVLALLNPYLQAAAYSRTRDASILDRLFPEVRELVVEIVQRLQHRAS